MELREQGFKIRVQSRFLCLLNNKVIQSQSPSLKLKSAISARLSNQQHFNRELKASINWSALLLFNDERLLIHFFILFSCIFLRYLNNIFFSLLLTTSLAIFLVVYLFFIVFIIKFFDPISNYVCWFFGGLLVLC